MTPRRLIDSIRLSLRAGMGGSGGSFFDIDRKPMGGDGGDGGSIFCIEDSSLQDLKSLIPHQRGGKFIQAEHGQSGSSNNKSGKGGDDILLNVPIGTTFSSTRKVIEVSDKPILLVSGGRKGKGNQSMRQGNDICTPGEAGEQEIYSIELRHIADIGLVGPPNAGKSSLLRSLTRSRCRVASYPFTTLYPNLGSMGSEGIIIADIPGLIEGAAKNRGLGHRFLKHLERSKIISLVLDASLPSLLEDIKMLFTELKEYKNSFLIPKIQMIILNKADLISYECLLIIIKEIEEWYSIEHEGAVPCKIFPISALHNAATKIVEEALRGMIIKS